MKACLQREQAFCVLIICGHEKQTRTRLIIAMLHALCAALLLWLRITVLMGWAFVLKSQIVISSLAGLCGARAML
jgi:hypothetical protein